jgi:hypothetical protein
MWTTFHQHLQERKHTAFMRWVASGYADTAAHREFIAAYEELIRWRFRAR